MNPSVNGRRIEKLADMIQCVGKVNGKYKDSHEDEVDPLPAQLLALDATKF